MQKKHGTSEWLIFSQICSLSLQICSLSLKIFPQNDFRENLVFEKFWRKNLHGLEGQQLPHHKMRRAKWRAPMIPKLFAPNFRWCFFAATSVYHHGAPPPPGSLFSMHFSCFPNGQTMCGPNFCRVFVLYFLVFPLSVNDKNRIRFNRYDVSTPKEVSPKILLIFIKFEFSPLNLIRSSICDASWFVGVNRFDGVKNSKRDATTMGERNKINYFIVKCGLEKKKQCMVI